MNNILSEADFEFYTFITGLENKEQILIEKLIESFPYKQTHKLNIIDKSNALKSLFDKEEVIKYSERHYIKKEKLDFNFEQWNSLKKKYLSSINIIKEENFDFHMTSFHKIMTQYANQKYTVILDSDVEFINKNYLTNVIKLLKKYDHLGDVSAVGEVYQEAPFSLPLNRNLPNDFYKLLIRDRTISILKAMFGIIRYYLIGMKKTQADRIHKLPRLFFGLLTVNKEIYLREKMFSKYLWLDVIDTENNLEQSNRIMGDAGSSLFYQIGMAGKKIIHLNYRKYVKHQKKGSRKISDRNKFEKNWLRFDKIEF
ncbi:hypothetical protein OA856_03215 [Pelagibacteraceae bacterium]|nr:hypothetical protein [Pelagibacteraceae bacterium]